MSERHTESGDVPDVSSTGINASAKTIWQAVKATDSFVKYSTQSKLHGLPGRRWTGAVNAIINDLWPALNDRYLTDKEQAEEVKLTLNRFLRHNKAMVCTQDGGWVKKSVWFVADHWPELTVTPGKPRDDASSVVTDEAATVNPTAVGTSAITPLDVFNLSKPAMTLSPSEEEKSEETMTKTSVTPGSNDDDVVEHPCRLETCTQTFTGLHWRATHEATHGFRVNEDGTVTNFDPESPAPDEEQVQDLIVEVCEGKEPMNQAQIIEAVRKVNPRASGATTKLVLQILIEDGWFERSVEQMEGSDNPKSRTRRYRFIGQPTKKSRKNAVAEAIRENSFVATAVATLAEVQGAEHPQRLKRYHDVIQEMLTDLAQLNTLVEELKVEREKNRTLEIRLTEVTAERDELKVSADASEELRLITAERDELQGKLDNLKKAFGAL
jgi:hypothetical protein